MNHPAQAEIHELLTKRGKKGASKTEIESILSKNGVTALTKGMILLHAKARLSPTKQRYYLAEFLPAKRPDSKNPGVVEVVEIAYLTKDGDSITQVLKKPLKVKLPKIL